MSLSSQQNRVRELLTRPARDVEAARGSLAQPDNWQRRAARPAPLDRGALEVDARVEQGVVQPRDGAAPGVAVQLPVAFAALRIRNETLEQILLVSLGKL